MKFRTIVLFLGFAASAIAINSHPRLLLSPTMLNELKLKACVGQGSGCVADSDFVAIKRDADTLKTYVPQAFTVASMSNSNPLVVTVNETITSANWASSGASAYIGGLTGPACTSANSWTCLNTTSTRVSVGAATRTGPHTFTLPFDSTSWGAYPGGAVLFFNNMSCSACLYYDYEGLGWLSWFEELGLMYQLTGDSTYATPALQLLDYINTLAPVNLVAPFAIDLGYPARGAVLGVALAFDWFYPLLSPNEKAATVATLNYWYTFYQANINNSSILFLGRAEPTSNYWGGFMLGFGAAGLATDSETGNNAAAIETFIRSQIDTYIAQTMSVPQTGWYPDSSDVCPYSGGIAPCGGSTSGGYPSEGYNYGINHMERLLEYMFMVQTATNEDMFTTTTYAPAFTLAVARNMIHSLFPNMWQAPNVGESADVIPIYQNLPWVIAYLRQGEVESGWMQYMVQHMNTPPAGLSPVVGFQGGAAPIPMDHFLWYRSSIVPIDYTATEPPYYFSNGDGEIHWRSDWTSNATQVTFAASPTYPAGHHIRNAAGVTISRGADYIIINAGEYAGTNGYSGAGAGTTVSDYSPTLHFDDGKAYMFGYNAQQNWGQWITPLYKLKSNYAYAQNDFTGAYDDKPGYRIPAQRTLRYYFRSVAEMPGGSTFVYDRVGASQSSYAKKVYWYISPITQANPAVSGNSYSADVGSSRVFITPMLPAAPNTAVVKAPVGSSYRVEISDSANNATTAILTLIYVTAAVGTMPSATVLTSSTNSVAVQVADIVPNVFVHANVVTDNGDNTYTATPQTSITLVSTHDGTGNYLVGGLAAGIYHVLRNGTVLTGLSSLPVDANGVLYFSAPSGSLSIAQTSSTPPQSGATACDLNGDGLVDSADVQLAINQALGSAPCSSADLNADGVCNVVDVQRVIDAAHGRTCIVGR